MRMPTKRAMKLVPIRIPDEMIERIDAVRGKTERAVWIREAIEKRLPVVKRPRKPRQPREKKEMEIVIEFRRPDHREVYEALQTWPATEQDLRNRLEWQPLRVANAINALLNQGVIRTLGEGRFEVR